MEIFANCRPSTLDRAGRAGSYPREFLGAAVVAFVEIERNYIARQNRDRETRYGSQHEEDSG